LDSGTVNFVIFLLIVVATVGQLLVKKFKKTKQARERGVAEPPPPAEEAEEEPKLPYEDLVDQLFGPYVERRKREFAAKQAAAKRARAPVAGPRAPGPPAAAAPRPAPARPAGEPEVKATPVAPPVLLALPAAHHHSLDARLFRNRGLSQGAKLVLASEILGRPKYFRR
jgi:hypothetical protein